MNQRYFVLTTLVPNGKRASFAILKNCFPKGIPTIVTHKMHPIIAFVIASSIPDMHIHRIFKRNETAPPSSTISFPKGFKEIDESLKHWIPTGIPTTVMHHKIPASHHPIALKSPPKIIHKMFQAFLLALHLDVQSQQALSS